MNEPPRTILRDSERPIYRQLVDALEHMINAGQLKLGEMLPSESTLMTDFGVSRITVRQALSHLKKRGLVVRKQGKGTFVSAPHLHQELNLEAKTIVETLREMGIEPDVTILGLDHVAPPQRVQQAFDTDEKTVVLLRRLYTHEGSPIALVYLYLPLALSGVAYVLARDDHLKETTYSVFEKGMQINIKEAKHIIGTVALDDEAAAALNMKPGEPCLTMDRITYSDKGAVLEMITFYYPTDSFHFEITLPRHENRIALKMSEGI